MKILYIIGVSLPYPGAVWTRISSFAKANVEEGHEVEVLGTFSISNAKNRVSDVSGGITIYNLIFRIGLFQPPFFILNFFSALISSIQFLLKRKPDAVIVSVPSGDSGLGTLLGCKIYRSKCIVDYRDEWEDYRIFLSKSKLSRFFFRIIKKFAALLYTQNPLITVNTPSIQKSLQKRVKTKIRVISNGADVQVFKPTMKQETNKPFTLFYLGGIGGYYRVDLIIKALKRLILEKRNIRLLFAGSGEVKQIKDLAVSLGIGDYIEYLGVIDDKRKLNEIMNQTDVGIIPYDDNLLWNNTLPAKFFEYCASGLPVIATTHNESLLSQIIRENKVGLTVSPMNDQELASAIKQMQLDNDYRKLASENARKLIVRVYDRNNIAMEFSKLIQLVQKSENQPLQHKS